MRVIPSMQPETGVAEGVNVGVQVTGTTTPGSGVGVRVRVGVTVAEGGTTVNAWKLTRAWPSRWTGPAFDALSGDIAFEEIELSFEDLDWIEHNRTLTGG